MAADLHVSISAEPIFYIGNFAVTNSMFTSVIVSLLIIAFALYANSKIKNTNRPQGLQNVLEMIVETFYNLTQDITQNHKTSKLLFPLTTSFFIFIMLNNWSGLVPGVGTIGVSQDAVEHSSINPHLTGTVQAAEDASITVQEASQGQVGNVELIKTDDIQEEHEVKDGHGTTMVPILRAGTADLNTTIALALISVGATQVIGFKYLSFGYFKKFFNFKNPIFFFVGILELISEFAKIISFAFRLFGNIFAGEVLLVVIFFLLPLLAPIPFLGLEIFVGVIQALVFTMLSLVFMSMATHAHEDEH